MLYDLRLLLALPLLTALVWFWVSRRDRRQQHIQNRLATLTGNNGPTPQASLLRAVSRTSAIGVLLPHSLKTRLDDEFAATGNSIGILHLLITSLIVAVIIVGFTTRILALNHNLVIPLAVLGAVVAPFMLVRIAQARYQNRFLN